MLAGFTCHARGVALESSDAKGARAIVKSKRAHTVDLRVANGKLLVKCSCPAESMGVHPCQHAWAALLEIDKQGGLAELRTKRGPMALECVSDEAAPKPERKPERTPKPASRPRAPAKTNKTKTAKRPQPKKARR